MAGANPTCSGTLPPFGISDLEIRDDQMRGLHLKSLTWVMEQFHSREPTDEEDFGAYIVDKKSKIFHGRFLLFICKKCGFPLSELRTFGKWNDWIQPVKRFDEFN